LIVVGLIGFVVSTVTFTQRETIVDLGPIEVQETRERTIPIGPIGTGLVVIGGIVLIVAAGRKSGG
jgi:hypothetical protein